MKTLKERTQVIIRSIKATKSGIWNVAKELNEINENKLFKEEGHTSMEEYVENHKDEFGFGYRQAQKYITTVRELKIDELGSLSLSDLLVITQLPKERKYEIIEEIKENKIDEEETMKKARSLKFGAGGITYYTTDPKEFVLKLIRQGKDLIQAKIDLGIAIENWIVSAKKQDNHEIKEIIGELR